MSRANRILWTVVGLILTAAGVVGILINLGHLPGTDRHVTLLTDGMSARWRTWGGWATAVVIAVGVIVAAAGIALIRAELRRRGGKSLPDVAFTNRRAALMPDGPTSDDGSVGRVRVSGSTLRHALQRDLQNNPRIKHAAVRLTGRTERPRLHLQLDVDRDADLPTVHADVADALTRFRTTSQLEPTLAKTTIRIA